MLIPLVEQGLERLLRAALPLPELVGDISFDAPSRSWSARLSRITVNVFLFGVGRSAQPPRPVPERTNAQGRVERRPAVPMVELNYLISAWAGNVRDEHELIGDLLGCLLEHQSLPAEFCAPQLLSSVQIAVAPSDSSRAKEVFASVDGSTKTAFEIVLTTALDSGAWRETAPAVARIEALTSPVPREAG